MQLIEDSDIGFVQDVLDWWEVLLPWLCSLNKSLSLEPEEVQVFVLLEFVDAYFYPPFHWTVIVQRFQSEQTYGIKERWEECGNKVLQVDHWENNWTSTVR